MRILLADDERFERELLTETLESWGHQVVAVDDGEEAWQKLEAGEEFSLLITDWVMARLDGPELCRRIRAASGRRYLPTILFSSLDRIENVIDGLNAGADAFLKKPLNPPVLLAQIRMAERILALEQGLERRLRELEDANQRIRRDLAAAAVVQASHLPKDPIALRDVEFAWVYEACQALGGDMFNVVRLDEHHVGMYVLDVSGHGTSAALLSVSLSRTLGPHPQQGGILKRRLPQAPHYEIVQPGEVAAELNRRFQLVEESGHFCTFLYGVYDRRTRCFRYASAGHPGPIELSGIGARAHHGIGGVPIGILHDAEYAEGCLELAPGSQVILYTDGVSEAVNRDGEQLGESRILGVAGEAGASGTPVAQTVEALRKQLIEFAQDAGQRDDITIVGLGVR